MKYFYFILLFLSSFQALGQRSTRQCEIEALESNFKDLTEKIEFYSSIILSTSSDNCDQITRSYRCYKLYLDELKTHRGLYNLLVSRHKLQDKNIKRLLRKSALSSESLDLVAEKYRDCLIKTDTPPAKTKISFQESRKMSDRKIQKDLINLDKEGDFDVTVYQNSDSSLWEIPIMSYLEKDYKPGYYGVPKKAGDDLNKFIKFIKKVASRDSIPITNISVYTTGYADGLNINNTKYSGTEVKGFGLDTTEFVINKYMYFPNDQRKGIFRSTGTTFKMNQKFESNERLALARTIEPRIIIQSHLKFSKFFHIAVDYTNKTGGDFRKARAIIVLPGYFKEIKELLEESDKAKFEDIKNQPLDISQIIGPFRQND